MVSRCVITSYHKHLSFLRTLIFAFLVTWWFLCFDNLASGRGVCLREKNVPNDYEALTGKIISLNPLPPLCHGSGDSESELPVCLVIQSSN